MKKSIAKLRPLKKIVNILVAESQDKNHNLTAMGTAFAPA